MTYNWTTFNLQDALSGTLVGFRQTNEYDLSKTGVFERNVNKVPNYKVVIGGVVLGVNKEGAVETSQPTSAYIGQTLQMVRAEMGEYGAVGRSLTRSSGPSGEGFNNVAVLANIEPRDQFAVQVLNAILIHTDHPESFDDAKCLMYSRAAYRWAQAMMIAAADSREGQSTTPSTTVDVNSGDLQSNTEKLLYNLVNLINKQTEEGLPVVGVGSTEENIVPILTKLDPDSEIKKVAEITEVKKVTENTSVKVTSMPSTTHVSVDGTPDVYVVNRVSTDAPSSVSVNNFPSSIAVTGTVSVDNFPSGGENT